MLEIQGIWLCHMSRWDRYVLLSQIWVETLRSGTVPHIGPYTREPTPPKAPTPPRQSSPPKAPSPPRQATPTPLQQEAETSAQVSTEKNGQAKQETNAPPPVTEKDFSCTCTEH